MDVGVLYSGGKDSTLAALLLEPFGNVTLLCCTFGVTNDYEHAQEAGSSVGFETQRVDLDSGVATAAAEQIVDDGYPRNGIQTIHEHAVEHVADLAFDAVADGTRRDDRVPTISRPLAQSVEDRYDVSYLAPLAGIGRKAIDSMVEAKLRTETGPSPEIPKGDYEAEVRTLIAAEYSDNRVEDLFPEHTQSRVRGRQK
ncbi:alpha hydrolase [Halovenus rubra]|uniref:Alpha hydrolase n=2 Tax=Halovenus rubra TaxID=869890 RepID=A0ABD5X4K2_9EURY|nr:alpha hydrolase [Halovenus rubra]